MRVSVMRDTKSMLILSDTLETKYDNPSSSSSLLVYPHPSSASGSSPLVHSHLVSALKYKKPATLVAGFDYAMDFLLKQLALG